jgi:hypothetical protein
VQLKNVSDATWDLPTLGRRVPAGETFTVDADAAKSLLNLPAFERVDKPTKTSERRSES